MYAAQPPSLMTFLLWNNDYFRF